jgi:hypothetical protein
MALLHIDVTTEDIERGIRGDSRSCPVTLALRRALSLGTWDDELVAVGDEEILIGTQYLPTPDTVAEFIGYFDRNAMTHVHPFGFVLDFPDDDGPGPVATGIRGVFGPL